MLTHDLHCDGFYHFFQARYGLFQNILSKWLRGTPEDVEAVVLHGEWCGPGIQKKVGISKIDSPIFVIFDIRLIDSTYEKGNTGFLDYKNDLEDFKQLSV